MEVSLRQIAQGIVIAAAVGATAYEVYRGLHPRPQPFYQWYVETSDGHRYYYPEPARSRFFYQTGNNWVLKHDPMFESTEVWIDDDKPPRIASALVDAAADGVQLTITRITYKNEPDPREDWYITDIPAGTHSATVAPTGTPVHAVGPGFNTFDPAKVKRWTVHLLNRSPGDVTIRNLSYSY